VPHDLESGLEECLLNRRRRNCATVPHTAIELMTDNYPYDGPNGPSRHAAEHGSNSFSGPTHRRVTPVAEGLRVCVV
jgi:hypothetical protein